MYYILHLIQDKSNFGFRVFTKVRNAIPSLYLKFQANNESQFKPSKINKNKTS